ncbi:hypothetical protein [Hydrogenophaga sp.]|uniref:hypothetical protein n=2 Tax=Pseudomonadota TaxID=1224 RepID=UPI00272F352B|nr:hypothetical protein [Hydrogenophaga sp.]MDP2074639.1 hypothetical protein [Hydrogenophaga sp.]MDP3106392.1 hypothetical protein [Hydrogenophaga sp.]
MAMKPACIQAVNQAAGRILRPAEIQGIEDRISGTMRRLAQADPVAWRGKSMDVRVMEAATTAMKDLQAEAARKVANVQRQALATAATGQRIGDLRTNMASGQSKALVQDIANTQLYADGIKRQNVSQLMDLIDAATSKEGTGIGRRAAMFLFDAQNPQMTKDLVNEIFAMGQGGTGNKTAQSGAKAWLEVIEGMRQRFNSAGGDVGRLAYGYLPQPHDSARVRNVGKDAWAAKTLPLLDRARYVREDGSRMADNEVLDFLRASYDTIATDGLNKTTPGQVTGSGARANKGSDSRQIHFKDGEAYTAYLSDFGRGSMYDAMIGHVGVMARDIGLVERYGPNPESQFRLQNDLAERADQGVKRVFGNKPQAYWDLMTGKAGAPESARLAQVGQDIRNIQTFGKLAGAVLSSITDVGTLMVTSGYNKLGYWQTLKNVGKQASPEVREFLTSHGLIAESLLSDLNRWAGDNIANNWSGRLANSTMRLSLMNVWTDSMRRGFSMTMMQGLAKLSQTKWADLTEWDRSHLGRKGITEADWDVVTRAQLTDFQGAKFLTPEAIAASGDPRSSEVTAKVLGFITDESEYAIINPDLATRAIQTWGGQQAGTGVGELARMTMQFKSFPIAMISRHWRRMLEGDRGIDGAPKLANKAAYAAALFITTTALGAVAFQSKQVVQGKDPVDMTTPKFWARAAAQGGGLGFMGDLVLGDTTDDRSPLDSLSRITMGPTFGSAADLWELTKGNIDELRAGKDTHAGAEALRFSRSHLPYINLWYGRTALDHLVLHGLQENLSPGYLQRQRSRHQKDWGGDYWWEPGADFDDMRAPDMGAAIGE